MYYFINRYDAAIQLGKKLEKYRQEYGVVLAVPRGGVPIAYYLARHLNFQLDLLMSKKIGHPFNEEFAIGAVGLEDEIIEETQEVSPEYIRQVIQRIRKQLNERYKKFMGEKKPQNIRGKTVIIVDDGIATGRTILANLKMLRERKPLRLVVAAPVASPEAAERIRKEVDDFVCLYTPSPFYAVGNFYQDFSETSDEQVASLLQKFNAKDHKVALI